MRLGLRSALSLGLLLVAVLAMAQVRFTYQGRLLTGGAPANGQYDFEVMFFDSHTGGTHLHTDYFWIVTVKDGLFTLLLNGPANWMSAGNPVWLEIRVAARPGPGPFSTLTPRVLLLPTPYAFFSQRPWITNPDSSLYYTAGRVGIGDASPLATFTVGDGDKFQVDGSTGGVRFLDPNASLQFPGSASYSRPIISMFDTGTTNARRMVVAHSPAFGAWGLEYQDDQDEFHFRNAFDEVLTISLGDGFTGIQNPSPYAPLSFRSNLGLKIGLWGDFTSSYGIGIGPSTLQLIVPNSTDGIAFGTGNSNFFTERMRVRGSGEVTIGTNNAVGRVTLDSGAATGIWAVNSGNSLTASVWARNSGDNGNGVVGDAFGLGAAVGVWGRTPSGSGNNFAGYFSGRVQVIGNHAVSGTKSFKIDHPLDPQNRYLYHYSVESPEVLNIYRGSVVLDASGEATVELPDYFSAINREVMAQFTPVGAAMPNLHLAEEITGPTFKIAGGVPGKRVQWVVTAQRNDLHVQQHGAPVEVWKPEHARGTYLDATLFGLPAEESEVYQRDRAVAETKR